MARSCVVEFCKGGKSACSCESPSSLWQHGEPWPPQALHWQGSMRLLSYSSSCVVSSPKGTFKKSFLPDFQGLCADGTSVKDLTLKRCFGDVRGLSKLQRSFALVRGLALIGSIAERRCAEKPKDALISNDYRVDVWFRQGVDATASEITLWRIKSTSINKNLCPNTSILML